LTSYNLTDQELNMNALVGSIVLHDHINAINNYLMEVQCIAQELTSSSYLEHVKQLIQSALDKSYAVTANCHANQYIDHDLYFKLAHEMDAIHQLLVSNSSVKSDKDIMVSLSVDRARIEHFHCLINHLLRNELPPPESIQITEIVRMIMRLQKSKKRPLTVSEPIPENIIITGIPLVIVAILDQFVRNAVDAVDEASSAEAKITLEIVDMRDGHVKMTIADNGCGIPSERLSRLFEAGSTKGAGRGLGLRIVKSLANRSGYNLAAESMIGEGTRISLIVKKSGGSVERFKFKLYRFAVKYLPRYIVSRLGFLTKS
jgi:signal transduction histidine kinase